MVARSPLLGLTPSGSATLGRQTPPGYGLSLGPLISNTGTMGNEQLLGCAPRHRLTYMRFRSCPANQPGSKATAPDPSSGHAVRLVVGGVPPQGYIHCIPKGNVSLTIRLFPRHPG